MNNSSKEFADRLVGLSCKIILDEYIWLMFGFKKQPRRGSFFNKFISAEQLNKEKTFLREIFIVSLAYGLNYLNKINSYTLSTKIFYSMMERLIEQGDIHRAFDFDNNDEMYSYLADGINEYIEKEFKDCHLILLSKLINKTENEARWLMGALKLGVEKNIELFINETLVDFQVDLIDDISLKLFEQ